MEVTDRVVRWSVMDVNVLRQLQIIQIQHTYVMSSQKNKKELFDYTLLRCFLPKKSDFLGILKNVLKEFHCVLCQV